MVWHAVCYRIRGTQGLAHQVGKADGHGRVHGRQEVLLNDGAPYTAARASRRMFLHVNKRPPQQPVPSKQQPFAGTPPSPLLPLPRMLPLIPNLTPLLRPAAPHLPVYAYPYLQHRGVQVGLPAGVGLAPHHLHHQSVCRRQLCQNTASRALVCSYARRPARVAVVARQGVRHTGDLHALRTKAF